MGRGVYTLALRGLAPLIWLWMWRRARRAGGQWELFAPARFGRAGARAPAPLAAPVWVHAVSLGETRAAQPLVQALLERGLPVLLTHTTATGRAEGERLFGAAIGRGQLQQAWLPYDFPGATRRFLARHAPRCGLLIEREVWPNLLAAARAQGVPMALVSARFSASSLRQAGWLGQALREALAGLGRVLAQTDEDGARLCQAGANAYTVTGSLKFDVALPEAQLRVGHAWAGATGRPVIALASTREGEDAMFIEAIGALQAHRAATPRPLILLIPRHPQRFDEAAAQLQAAGLAYARRSAGSGEPGPHIDVLLGDTLGEMPFYYAAADVAIVGGSFARLGGQNLIEACAAGTPVIVGPHTFNFKDAARDAIAAGVRAPDARTALDWALQLLAEPARRQAMSEAARAWTAAHAGATRRTLDALEDWLAPR